MSLHSLPQPDLPGLSWLYDEQSQPDPALCHCGLEVEYVWWRPSQRHRDHPLGQPQWKLKGCRCTGKATRDLTHLELWEKRLKDAGVPGPLRGRSLARLAHWDGVGTREDWMRWVSAQYPRLLGVLSTEHFDAIERISDWKPEMVTGGWLYVHGPVGTGKSQVLAALIEDRAKPTIEGWRYEDGSEVVELEPIRPGGRTMVRPSELQWLWVSETDVMWAYMQEWKGNPDAFYNICKAEVLIVDEWGNKQTQPAKHVPNMRERLVQYRIDGEPRRRPLPVLGGRPTVFASNTPWSKAAPDAGDRDCGAECAFGARIASRLREYACDIEIGGMDWRDYVRRAR